MAKIGFAKVEITPPLGTKLAGYTRIERPAVGVHDPLFGRVLLLESQGELFCLVQLDLVGVDEYFVKRLHFLIKDLGIEEDNLIVAATHTHSGPKGVFDQRSILDQTGFGLHNEDLVRGYLAKIESAIKMSFKNRKQLSEIKVGQTFVPNVGSERHDNSAADDRLFTMLFNTADGESVLLYNFSCHPTILHYDNLQISSDLPYGVLKYLGNSYNQIMFTNGSAGDISTRFTRQDTVFEEVERLGALLGEAIETSLAEPIFVGQLDEFKIKRYTIPLQFREIPDVGEAELAYEAAVQAVKEAERLNLSHSELRVVESRKEGARRDLDVAKTMASRDNLEVQVTIFKLNDWKFITIPGEIFASLSEPIRVAGNNVIIGYANGYYLYFADKEAFAKKYYEASSSFIREGEGEKLVSFILDRLADDFGS